VFRTGAGGTGGARRFRRAAVAGAVSRGPRPLVVHRRSARQSHDAARCRPHQQGPADGLEEAAQALSHWLTMREVIWIRRLALLGALLALCVVVLGGYTRLSNSGLGCPDWPGCFGHIAPTGSAEHYATASDVRKAWVEMIHRYGASTLGLVILVITAFAIVARRERGVSVAFALTLLALVVLQGILGMLTVTWLLKPLIVTGHLVGGLTTFAMLLWLWLTLRAHARPVDGGTVLAGNTLMESGSGARLW